MPDTAPKRRRPAPGNTTGADNGPETAQEPRRESPKPPKVNPPGKPVGVLQQKLERFLVSMALPFAAAGDMQCASVFATRGPIVAEAWANLAAESPAVKRALESMLKGGAWAGALSTTAALIIPIAAHHGAPIPDFASAIILGNTSQEKQESHTHPVEEPIVTRPSAPPAPGVTPAPGPAAVSVPGVNGTNRINLTDPANYPGIHPES